MPCLNPARPRKSSPQPWKADWLSVRPALSLRDITAPSVPGTLPCNIFLHRSSCLQSALLGTKRRWHAGRKATCLATGTKVGSRVTACRRAQRTGYAGSASGARAADRRHARDNPAQNHLTCQIPRENVNTLLPLFVLQCAGGRRAQAVRRQRLGHARSRKQARARHAPVGAHQRRQQQLQRCVHRQQPPGRCARPREQIPAAGRRRVLTSIPSADWDPS